MLLLSFLFNWIKKPRNDCPVMCGDASLGTATHFSVFGLHLRSRNEDWRALEVSHWLFLCCIFELHHWCERDTVNRLYYHVLYVLWPGLTKTHWGPCDKDLSFTNCTLGNSATSSCIQLCLEAWFPQYTSLIILPPHWYLKQDLANFLLAYPFLRVRGPVFITAVGFHETEGSLVNYYWPVLLLALLFTKQTVF